MLSFYRINLQRKLSAIWLEDGGGLGQLVLGGLEPHVTKGGSSRNSCRVEEKTFLSPGVPRRYPFPLPFPYHFPLFSTAFHSTLLFLLLFFTTLSFRYFTHLSVRIERFPDGGRLSSTSFLAICITVYTPVSGVHGLEEGTYYTKYARQLEKCEGKMF